MASLHLELTSCGRFQSLFIQPETGHLALFCRPQTFLQPHRQDGMQAFFSTALTAKEGQSNGWFNSTIHAGSIDIVLSNEDMDTLQCEWVQV